MKFEFGYDQLAKSLSLPLHLTLLSVEQIRAKWWSPSPCGESTWNLHESHENHRELNSFLCFAPHVTLRAWALLLFALSQGHCALYHENVEFPSTIIQTPMFGKTQFCVLASNSHPIKCNLLTNEFQVKNPSLTQHLCSRWAQDYKEMLTNPEAFLVSRCCRTIHLAFGAHIGLSLPRVGALFTTQASRVVDVNPDT